MKKLPKGQNPNKIYGLEEPLSKDPKIREVELISYMVGEFSEYQELASAFALEPKEGLTLGPSAFELFSLYESMDNSPITALKTLQACRNGVYQLSNDTMKQNQEVIKQILQKIPLQLKKCEGLPRTTQYLKDILNFLKNYQERLKALSLFQQMTQMAIMKQKEKNRFSKESL